MFAVNDSEFEHGAPCGRQLKTPLPLNVLVVDLAETGLQIDGTTLKVTLPKRVQEIDLKAQDAERLTRYLASKRKAHPMR